MEFGILMLQEHITVYNIQQSAWSLILTFYSTLEKQIKQNCTYKIWDNYEHWWLGADISATHTFHTDIQDVRLYCTMVSWRMCALCLMWFSPMCEYWEVDQHEKQEMCLLCASCAHSVWFCVNQHVLLFIPKLPVCQFESRRFHGLKRADKYWHHIWGAGKNN